jgi:hypothetical protein
VETEEIQEKPIAMKVCSSCSKNLDINMFSQREISKDGFNNRCKLCISKNARKNYEK